MYVSAKKMAFLGLLLACTVLIVILSGVFEFNTLFLLAGASFAVGIAIREAGLKLGAGFYIASVLLCFLIASNKAYCLTFAAMGLYLLVIEFSWEKLINAKWCKKKNLIFWIIKYASFNLMYVFILLCLPSLVYSGKLSGFYFLATIIGGQIFLFVYDKAYGYFQQAVWGKLRRHINK